MYIVGIVLWCGGMDSRAPLLMFLLLSLVGTIFPSPIMDRTGMFDAGFEGGRVEDASLYVTSSPPEPPRIASIRSPPPPPIVELEDLPPSFDLEPPSPPSPPVFGVSGDSIYFDGGLDVFGNVTISDAVVHVSGDVIVHENSTLRLVNSTLVMHLVYDGEYGIDVLCGGSLILENSTIMSSRAEVNYYIRVFSGFLGIYSGSIMHSGFSWGDHGDMSGLWLNSSRFEIFDGFFYYCWAALNLHYSRGNVSGVEILDCFYGLYVKSSIVEIGDVSVGDAWYGVYIDRCGGVVVENVNVSGSIFGVYSRDSRGLSLSSLWLANNTYNVFMFSCSNVSIVDVDVDGDFFGMILHGCSGVSVESSEFYNNSVAGMLVHSTDNISIASVTTENNTYGVVVLSSSNVSMRSIRADGNVECGIYIRHSAVIRGLFLVAMDNEGDGFVMLGSSNASLEGLLFVRNGRDFYMGSSLGVNIYNITVRFGGFLSNGTTFDICDSSLVDVELLVVINTRENTTIPGVSIVNSSYVSIRNGLLFNCPIVVYDRNISRLLTLDISGLFLDFSPVVLLKNMDNVTISDFSQAIIINCSNVRASGSRVYDIHIYYSENVSVEGFELHDSTYGMIVMYSTNVVVRDASFDSCGVATYVSYSSRIYMENITVGNCLWGVSVEDSGHMIMHILDVYNISNAVVSASNVSIMEIGGVDMYSSLYGVVLEGVDSAYLCNISSVNATVFLWGAWIGSVIVVNASIVNGSMGIMVNTSDVFSIENTIIGGYDVGFLCMHTEVVSISGVDADVASLFMLVEDAESVSLHSFNISSVWNVTVFNCVDYVFVSDGEFIHGRYGLAAHDCHHLSTTSVSIRGGYLSFYVDTISIVNISDVDVLDVKYGFYILSVLQLEISLMWSSVDDTALYISDCGEVIIGPSSIMGEYGVFASESKDIWIINTSLSCVETCIMFHAIHNISIVNSSINGEYGVAIESVNASTISSSVINATNGIYCKSIHILNILDIDVCCGEYALCLDNSHNISILDTLIYGSIGLMVANTTHILVDSTNISSMTYGIYSYNISTIYTYSSTISSSGDALYVRRIHSLHMYDTTIYASRYGLYAYRVSNVSVLTSTLTGCTTTIYVYGGDMLKIENSHILGGGQNLTIGVYSNNTLYVSLEHMEIHNREYGVVITGASSFKYTHNTLQHCMYGVLIYDSQDIQISESSHTGNSEGIGLLLNDCRGINIMHNLVNNFSIGLEAYGSGDIIIFANNISNSESVGIILNSSWSTIIKMNNITHNSVGIINSPREGMDDTILIYLNNFISNSQHAYDYGKSRWNYISGNYWSENTNISDTDNNNVSEIPYRIGNQSYDYRPLIYPVKQYDKTPPEYAYIHAMGEFRSGTTISYVDLYQGITLTIGLTDTSELVSVVVRYGATTRLKQQIWINTTMKFETYIGFTQYYTAHIKLPPASEPIGDGKLLLYVYAEDYFGNNIVLQLHLNITRTIPEIWEIKFVRPIGIGGTPGYEGPEGEIQPY